MLSLDAAETGLRTAAAWRSLPGTRLRCRALIVHVALALANLHPHHTLRLSSGESLRIGFGLMIPLLPLDHALSTRVGFEWYGEAARHHRIVANLIWHRQPS